MKKLAIIWTLTALVAAGCSKDESVELRTTPEEETVKVDFRLEVPVDTDFSVRPMAADSPYKNFIRNTFKMLILKRIDSRWVVEDTKTVPIEAAGEEKDFNEYRLRGGLPACPFDLELRPGDYRIVAVLNYNAATWNRSLKPGVTVADDNDPTVSIPPLLTYTISTHDKNNGFKMLHREIFVAVTDFTVPKSSDLHDKAMPPLTLRAERRVGKLRFLLKETPGNYLTFTTTAYTINMLLTAKGEPFPDGIDALGGMYYEGQGMYELRWRMMTEGHFHTSGTNHYQISQTNSTVFSPFLFADPERGEQPFEISEIYITGFSGGPTYETDAILPRTLAVSKICGIVFEATTTYTGEEWPDPLVTIVESTNNGVPENALTLFDSYYEWNAAFVNKL